MKKGNIYKVVNINNINILRQKIFKLLKDVS